MLSILNNSVPRAGESNVRPAKTNSKNPEIAKQNQSSNSEKIRNIIQIPQTEKVDVS